MTARRDGLILAALGVLAFGVTLYLCAPGYIGPDGRTQLHQARAFEFRDDHPVLMALIWHYLDRLLPGPAGMLVFISALYWAGLSALFGVLPGPIGWRALGLLAVGFFPPGFSTLPVLPKDAIMHGALLLAVACVVAPTRRALGTRLAVSVICFLIAVAVRHNAAAAVWPFLALPFMRVQIIARLSSWLRLVVGSAAGLVLSFAMTWGVDRALAPLSQRTEFWQTVPTYDLAGMSLRSGKLLVDPDSPVFTQGMGLTEIQRLFHVEYGQYLYDCVPFGGRRCVHLFRRTQDPDELERLSQNWRSAIAQHPGAYLAHRWDVTRDMLTVNTTQKRALYYLTGAPHGPLARQYPPSERLLWVLTFMERHIQSVVYSPWIYVVMSLLLLPFTLGRYLRGAPPLPLLLVLSGTAYMLSILVGASSSTYRYCVWTILCTVLALFALMAPQGIGALRLRALFTGRSGAPPASVTKPIDAKRFSAGGARADCPWNSGYPSR